MLQAFPRYKVTANRSTYLRFIAGLITVKYLYFKGLMHLAVQHDSCIYRHVSSDFFVLLH